jgi:hypothetical protein
MLSMLPNVRTRIKHHQLATKQRFRNRYIPRWKTEWPVFSVFPWRWPSSALKKYPFDYQIRTINITSHHPLILFLEITPFRTLKVFAPMFNVSVCVVTQQKALEEPAISFWREVDWHPYQPSWCPFEHQIIPFHYHSMPLLCRFWLHANFTVMDMRTIERRREGVGGFIIDEGKGSDRRSGE